MNGVMMVVMVDAIDCILMVSRAVGVLFFFDFVVWVGGTHMDGMHVLAPHLFREKGYWESWESGVRSFVFFSSMGWVVSRWGIIT
jgi:hypothetical protein